MLRNIFIVLGVVGFIIICVLAFIIPKDPFIIIPSYTYMGFNKPLWLDIIIIGGLLYECILWCIYDKTN